jgi:HSP20 family protein
MPKRDVEEWFWQISGDLKLPSEDLSAGRPRIANARFWEPRIDLVEEGDRFLVKAELAGVRGQDIEILYLADRHALLIRGSRSEGDLSEGVRHEVHQLEIYYGEFQREIRLPSESEIEPEHIRARYKNGFLYVLIPKRDQVVGLSITVTQI